MQLASVGCLLSLLNGKQRSYIGICCCVSLFFQVCAQNIRPTLTTAVKLWLLWHIIKNNKALLFFALSEGTASSALPPWRSDARSSAIYTYFDSTAVHLSWMKWSGESSIVECFDTLIWFIPFYFNKHLFKTYPMPDFGVAQKTKSPSQSSRNSQSMVEKER